MRKDWEKFHLEMYKRLKSFIKTIDKNVDIDLIDEIEEWMEDVFINEGTEEIPKIYSVKNDDDWEEIEYELNNLYDIFDQQKMVWVKWL